MDHQWVFTPTLDGKAFFVECSHCGLAGQVTSKTSPLLQINDCVKETDGPTQA